MYDHFLAALLKSNNHESATETACFYDVVCYIIILNIPETEINVY
jgi:hypothetical protein